MKRSWLKRGAWPWEFRQIKYQLPIHWVGQVFIGAGALALGLVLLFVVITNREEMGSIQFALALICPLAALSLAALTLPSGIIGCIALYHRRRRG
jgi:phosphatidylglycerophosphate synthase